MISISLSINWFKKRKNRLKSKINDAFLTIGMQSSPEENLSVSPSRIRSIPLSLSLYSCLFPFFLRFPFLWVFLLFCVGEPRGTAAERGVGVVAAAAVAKVVGEGANFGLLASRNGGTDRNGQGTNVVDRENNGRQEIYGHAQYPFYPFHGFVSFFIPFLYLFLLFFPNDFSLTLAFFQSITVGTVRLISRRYHSKELRIKLANNSRWSEKCKVEYTRMLDKATKR